MLFTPSPQKGSASAGKENRFGAQTPSRLPTVQEHDGMLPEVQEVDFCPVWLATPTPSKFMSEDDVQELGEAWHKIGLLSSPTPPGLQNVSRMQPHPVKNTFIQFESPKKTTGVRTPPKSVPPHFAPGLSINLESVFPDWESPPHWAVDSLPAFPSMPQPPVPQPPLMQLQLNHQPIMPQPPQLPVSSGSFGPYAALAPEFQPPAPLVALPEARTGKGTALRISDFLPDHNGMMQMPLAQPPLQSYDSIAMMGAQHGYDSIAKMGAQHGYEAAMQQMLYPMPPPPPGNTVDPTNPQGCREPLPKQWEPEQMPQIREFVPATSSWQVPFACAEACLTDGISTGGSPMVHAAPHQEPQLEPQMPHLQMQMHMQQQPADQWQAQQMVQQQQSQAQLQQDQFATQFGHFMAQMQMQQMQQQMVQFQAQPLWQPPTLPPQHSPFKLLGAQTQAAAPRWADIEPTDGTPAPGAPVPISICAGL